MILAFQTDTPNFFEILTSWSNPFFLSAFVLASLLLLLYFLNKYLIKPLEQKHILEKKEIELKNSRMMALFAEIDPDPVIRVDRDGNTIFFNASANELLHLEQGSSITEKYFKLSREELNSKIGSNESFTLPFKLGSVYYNVLIKGNSNLGIAQLYFRNITELKKLENKLRQLSNYLQNLIEEERYRMANELHDGIVQELYVIQMSLRNMLDETSNENLENIKKQLESTTEELRRIIYDLKPKILEEMGLEPALKILCNTIVKESSAIGSVQLIGLNERLEKKYEIYFYRLVQEAISNIVKHSGATEFNVTLVKDSRLIRVIISDNGDGINEKVNDENNLSGFGLFNMKERTESFGGVLKIDSTENSGFTIIAEIPYN